MKKNVLKLILLAALVAAAVTAGILLGRGQVSVAPGVAPSVGATSPAVEIDPNAGDRITPTPALAERGVAVPGWGSITVPAGVTDAPTSLQNPAENESAYYLTFELRLKDTGEVLFTTGLIPPGEYCNGITLNRPLEVGEYPAIVRVQPYRMSDLSPTNNADMETVLIVK